MSCWKLQFFGKTCAIMIGLLISAAAQAQLSTAVLPLARAIQTTGVATFSASYTNGGATTLSNCQTTLASDIPATLSSLDLSGNPLAPFSLGPAETFSLNLVITPSASFSRNQVFFDFVCDQSGGGTVEAPYIQGVNVISLSASDTPTADVVVQAATPTGDGILGVDPSNAFVVATTNLGASAEINVTPNTGGIRQPLALSICETDPLTGACLNPPTPSVIVNTTIDTNETPTFSVFASSTGTIPFDPATNRIFVPFIDTLDRVVGNTSVAVTSSVPPDSGRVAPGTWRDDENEVCFNVSLDGNRLTPVGSTCPDGRSLDIDLRSLVDPSGIPCKVRTGTSEVIQIVDDGIVSSFSWFQVVDDPKEFVYGQFEDPLIVNSGTAIRIGIDEGVCTGVWPDVTSPSFQ